MTTTANEVAFSKQRNGYDKEQVNRYVNMLAQEYQKACREHEAISDKYNKLLEDYKELEARSEQKKTSAGALSKVLIDAEAIAQKIIEDAYAEAEKIKGDACIEKIAAKRSLEAANETISQTISKLQSMLT